VGPCTGAGSLSLRRAGASLPLKAPQVQLARYAAKPQEAVQLPKRREVQ
jgi:hypothetical protein